MTNPVDYDKLAPNYDRRYQGNEYDGVERALLDFVGGDASQQLLEIGCGTGHWIQVLDRQGFSVCGLDPSEQMLSQARRKAPGATLKLGQAETIPWDDGVFDRVFVINALHHFESQSDFMSEARRVLRPGGGELMIVGRDPHAGLDRWYCDDYFSNNLEIDRKQYPTMQMVRESMRANGLSQCHTFVAERIRRQIPARSAIESGQMDQYHTSKLARLTRQEYEQGINRIWEAIEAAETRGEQLQLLTDLTLFATIGWL